MLLFSTNSLLYKELSFMIQKPISKISHTVTLLSKEKPVIQLVITIYL